MRVGWEPDADFPELTSFSCWSPDGLCGADSLSTEVHGPVLGASDVLLGSGLWSPVAYADLYVGGGYSFLCYDGCDGLGTFETFADGDRSVFARDYNAFFTVVGVRGEESVPPVPLPATALLLPLALSGFPAAAWVRSRRRARPETAVA